VIRAGARQSFYTFLQFSEIFHNTKAEAANSTRRKTTNARKEIHKSRHKIGTAIF
jgi:hypothetical protein